MDVILAIIFMAAINVGAADRALADPTGKCGYYANSHVQQVPRPCDSRPDGSLLPPDATAKWADERHSGAARHTH